MPTKEQPAGSTNDNQTDENVERVQIPFEDIPESMRADAERYWDEQAGKIDQESQASDHETGCVCPNTPLYGGNKDRRNDKVTYRFNYKTGGWNRRM